MNNLPKNKKMLIASIIIIVLLLIICGLGIFLYSRKTKPAEDQGMSYEDYLDSADVIGFGSGGDEPPSNMSGSDIPNSNEYAPSGYVGDASIPEVGEGNSYTYLSPTGTKEFDIQTGATTYENVLVIDGTNFKEKGVARGKWSSDESFIMYSKIEGEPTSELTDMSDTGNIWIVDANGKNNHKVYDSGMLNATSYVSNGEKIGFVNVNQVGVVDKDGKNLQILHEFEPYFPVQGVLSISDIREINSTTFEVQIQTANGVDVREFSY